MIVSITVQRISGAAPVGIAEKNHSRVSPHGSIGQSLAIRAPICVVRDFAHRQSRHSAIPKVDNPEVALDPLSNVHDDPAAIG
jgi:hypothetical protein